jgi:hypothetical protein
MLSCVVAVCVYFVFLSNHSPALQRTSQSLTHDELLHYVDPSTTYEECLQIEQRMTNEDRLAAQLLLISADKTKKSDQELIRIYGMLGRIGDADSIIYLCKPRYNQSEYIQNGQLGVAEFIAFRKIQARLHSPLVDHDPRKEPIPPQIQSLLEYRLTPDSRREAIEKTSPEDLSRVVEIATRNWKSKNSFRMCHMLSILTFAGDRKALPLIQECKNLPQFRDDEAVQNAAKYAIEVIEHLHPEE